MLPWQIKSIRVIAFMLRFGAVFLSIAHFRRKVERRFQVGAGHDLPLEFQLRPAELPSRLDIPCPLLGGKLRLQNDHVLRPADAHGLGQHLRRALIGAVELPHPAQIPGREAGSARVCNQQILRRGDSGSLLRPAAD